MTICPQVMSLRIIYLWVSISLLGLISGGNIQEAFMPIKTLSIDIETFSSVNLAKCGLYRYSESEDFEILLFGYSIDHGPVRVVDLAAGEHIPAEILGALKDDNVLKTAFNAAFERICLSRFLGFPTGTYLSPESWHCTMVWSAYLGLPLSLEGVGAVLGLEKQKLKEGRDLVRYFCTPCAPTASNGQRIRNRREDDISRWETLRLYNIRDVEVEIAIQERLSVFPVPDSIWREYVLDQKINDRGVLVDTELVSKAIEIDEESSACLKSEMQRITALENPNSVIQLRTWLEDRGISIDSLGKKDVKAVLDEVPGEIRELLILRLQLSKSSIRKFKAISNSMCSDNRCRGMFQFYGANRSGRWSGRLVQMQNLVRNNLDDLDTARLAVKTCSYDELKIFYDDIPDLLSQLIRTAFISAPGTRFIVSDYSAVEARVLSWLAGEEWRQEVFRNNGDLYSETASKMFGGIKVSKHGPNSHLRQKGKQAELGCGYGGSVGALKAMGALELGMKEEELQPLVDNWRKANPHIVEFWWTVDAAAKKAVKEKVVTSAGPIRFSVQKGIMFIRLPSGRSLSYIKPRMGTNRFGSESITYEGVGQTKKWERIETYGPKLVENIVQAVSRDLLAFAMSNLVDCRITMHIHDELVIEAPHEVPVEEITRIMSMTPSWAEGLVLNADGYETDFYKKD